jgi:hypothetical protein
MNYFKHNNLNLNSFSNIENNFKVSTHHKQTWSQTYFFNGKRQELSLVSHIHINLTVEM